MGNKCEDENWRHCCFPWASLLKPVKLTCSFHLFAMSLSIEHVRKLTYICIHAYIGSASQISNFSLFKAIFTICIFFKLDNKMNCLAWKKKKNLRGAQSMNSRSSRAAPPLTSCVRTTSNMRIKFLRFLRDTSALLHSLCICRCVHTALSSFSVCPSHMRKKQNTYIC